MDSVPAASSTKLAFAAHYGQGIYRYRVLGPFLLLKTHQALMSDAIPPAVKQRFFRLPPLIAVADKQADPCFYTAYVVLNTFLSDPQRRRALCAPRRQAGGDPTVIAPGIWPGCC